ncbi:MAG: hypothetical protein EBX41_09290 [Chitinophagia bacterium]|nr:hypothetical protein [Chitinophagia bacterium]
MNKYCFFYLVLFCCGLPLFLRAQDKLVLKDGETVDVKISSVNATDVTFKKYNNPSGPDYVYPLSKVSHVAYQNGVVDSFNRNAKLPAGTNAKKPTAGYSKFILRASPIMITENGVGLQCGIEKSFKKAKGIVYYSLPLTLTWNLSNIGYYFDEPKNDPMVYAYPGIKIYINAANVPNVSYSINPAFVIAGGRGTEVKSDTVGRYIATHKSRLVLGAIINGGINYKVTDNLLLGVELGIGVSYMNTLDGKPKSVIPLSVFDFNLGFRL